MNESSIRGFLFDLDGTLVHTAPDLCGTIHDMQSSRGLPFTPMDSMEHLSSGGARALLGIGFKVNFEDAAFQPLRKEFLERYEARIAQASHCYDGIEELLTAIEKKGHLWGVVTNKPYYLAEKLLDKLGLLDRCKALVGGDTAAKPKPSPLPCLHASNLLGASPSQCFMVGDDERDIVAGRAAGMITVAVRYGYIASNIDEWQADHIIDTSSDLKKLLEI